MAIRVSTGCVAVTQQAATRNATCFGERDDDDDDDDDQEEEDEEEEKKEWCEEPRKIKRW